MFPPYLEHVSYSYRCGGTAVEETQKSFLHGAHILVEVGVSVRISTGFSLNSETQRVLGPGVSLGEEPSR